MLHTRLHTRFALLVAALLLALTTFAQDEPEPLAAYAGFLRARGRDDEADEIEAKLDTLLQPVSAVRII